MAGNSILSLLHLVDAIRREGIPYLGFKVARKGRMLKEVARLDMNALREYESLASPLGIFIEV
jgi:hypothetical protein